MSEAKRRFFFLISFLIIVKFPFPFSIHKPRKNMCLQKTIHLNNAEEMMSITSFISNIIIQIQVTFVQRYQTGWRPRLTLVVSAGSCDLRILPRCTNIFYILESDNIKTIKFIIFFKSSVVHYERMKTTNAERLYRHSFNCMQTSMLLKIILKKTETPEARLSTIKNKRRQQHKSNETNNY